MTADTIRRLITNQKAEHSPHAFRAGGAGMANFNQRYPILRSLPMDELAEWLSLIDAMRATHGGGGACCCKILADEILFTREQLLSEVWGYDYFGGTRTVDVHVRRLRAKLGDLESLIGTVRNVGYRFNVYEDEDRLSPVT